MVSRRARKKRSQNITGAIVMTIAAVLIVSILCWYLYVSKSVFERDKQTQCRTDGEVSVETVFLFDVTDSYSSTQSLMIQKEIKKYIEGSEVDERMSFYVFDDSYDEISPKFVVCNPSDGSDKNEWTSNTRRLKKQWEENFFNPILEVVSNATGEDNLASASPILELIKHSALESLYDSPADHKRMVIVSDMLHHTGEYSHYRSQPNYSDYSQSTYSSLQSPQLSRVQVEVLYLTRPEQLNRQTRNHIAFWESHVTSHGGLLTRVLRVN